MRLEIGERFKNSYEVPQRYQLMKKIPVIVRVDGRSFHTLTRKLSCEKPYDKNLSNAMMKTTIALCEEFNAVFGYCQSDEISLLLLDDKKTNSQPIWNYELNKIVSISAATASVVLSKEINQYALFDSRAFNIPKDDIVNYFIWRQVDALRNARNGWSETTLSQKMGKKTAKKELQGLGAAKQVEKTEFETNANFIDMSNRFRMGATIVKIKNNDGRTKWVVDENTPWFIDNKEYILEQIGQFYGEYSSPERLSVFKNEGTKKEN